MHVRCGLRRRRRLPRLGGRLRRGRTVRAGYPARFVARIVIALAQRLAMVRPRNMPTTSATEPAAMVAHVPACAAAWVV